MKVLELLLLSMSYGSDVYIKVAIYSLKKGFQGPHITHERVIEIANQVVNIISITLLSSEVQDEFSLY